MSPGPNSNNPELRRCWMRFAEIVRMFAEKRASRGEIGQEHYESVHVDLLKSIRDTAESAPQQRELYLQMQALAQPWVNLGALQQADPAILKDLANRCDALYGQLTNRSPMSLSRGTTLAILVAIFLAVFLIALGPETWSWLYDRLFDDSGGKVNEWLNALERNRNHSRTWLIGIVVAIATVAVSWLVFRAPKTY